MDSRTYIRRLLSIGLAVFVLLGSMCMAVGAWFALCHVSEAPLRFASILPSPMRI